MNRQARRAVLVVALGAVVAGFVAGCGGGNKTAGGGNGASAAAFLTGVTTEFSRGQSGRLWATLYPSEQALVGKARFVGCEGNEGFGLRRIKVLETYPEAITVAGRSVQSQAVTIRVSADDGITTATVHAVPFRGGWRWVLQPADLAAYLAGKCPRG
jgi:hypothetical protein